MKRASVPIILSDIGVVNWGHSSAGRAPALHAGGRRFDPAWLHQFTARHEGDSAGWILTHRLSGSKTGFAHERILWDFYISSVSEAEPVLLLSAYHD